MLISNRHEFIFFHTPKVAGSSIRRALQKYSSIPSERLYHYIMEIFGQTPSIGAFNRHARPKDVRQILKSDTFNRHFKFAFVRNPWDWHVSQYHYHKNDPNAFFHLELKHLSFDEYIDWSIQNITVANSSQYDFLSDADGRLLVDFVGKFENLYSDFQYICDRIGIKNNLPHLNISQRHKDYRQYYDEHLKNIIAESNARDIKHFQYDF